MYKTTIQQTKEPKKFIIVTKDFSGLGWAIRLQDEGHEVVMAYKYSPDITPEEKDLYKMVGKGLVEKMPLATAIEMRNKEKEAYWIWDGNHNTKENTLLRDEGFKVFGSSEITDRMEHDREFGMTIIEDCGLDMPEYFESSDIKQGVDFLEQNDNRCFVFKPDNAEESDLTFVPSNWDDEIANNELCRYMNSLGDVGSYILQERKKGLEINVEVWFHKGTPYFAWCCLENKRKLNNDCGMNVGCAQDLGTTIPLECNLVKNTVGKMYKFYEELEYTGFADMNVIIEGNKYWFLEFCNRFGYNAHPNLFLNLANIGVGDLFVKMIDGDIENFYDNFKYGFGASISLYIDKPQAGLPIHIQEGVWQDFFAYDIYTDKDDHYLAGSSKEVGIVCKHGFTGKQAAKECLEVLDTFEEINYPNIAYRSDLAENWGTNSPLSRYEALEHMDALEVPAYENNNQNHTP